MNRRTLFKRGALALLALPFASFLPPRKSEGVGHTEISTRLQHKAFETDDLRVDGLSAEEALVRASDHINSLLKNFVDDCRRDRALPEAASLQWVNIRSAENPEGKRGYFRLIGQRWSPNHLSQQLLWPSLNDEQKTFSF